MIKLLGNLKLPGDKSISHRAAMLAAIADGATEIRNFASSADCAATVKCLQKLGVNIESENSVVRVAGVGKNGLTAPHEQLDCENSGTTVRLLSGILAGQNFASNLVGDESLSSRPMRRIIEPLKLMNCEISAQDSRLPMQIQGTNNLQSITYDLPVASAQVKSCVLLAGLNAAGKTTVKYQTKSAIRNPQSKIRNHTELMLRFFSVEVADNFVETDGGWIHETTIDGAARLTANGVLNVPSDISSAAFFLVAAACLRGSELKIENVGLNPTRTGILTVLENFGVDLVVENRRETNHEIVGDLIVRGTQNPAPRIVDANVLRGEIIANVIDELPILGVFGTQIAGGLEIRDAAELRVKETDRISAVVENLRRMNARVEEFPDGFRVEKSDLKGAQIESYGDHRIAMAFAVAGLLATGATEISGADCVKVSFPEFFETLETVKHGGEN